MLARKIKHMETRVAVLEYEMEQCRERLRRLEKESDCRYQNHLSRLATTQDVRQGCMVPIWLCVIVLYFAILIIPFGSH
jgi:hypothetical protein